MKKNQPSTLLALSIFCVLDQQFNQFLALPIHVIVYFSQKLMQDENCKKQKCSVAVRDINRLLDEWPWWTTIDRAKEILIRGHKDLRKIVYLHTVNYCRTNCYHYSPLWPNMELNFIENFYFPAIPVDDDGYNEYRILKNEYLLLRIKMFLYVKGYYM